MKVNQIKKNQPKLYFVLQSIWRGKSVARSFFNASMREVSVSGDVIDVGAGPRPYYQDLMLGAEKAKFYSIDPKIGNDVDFEKDTLPWPDNRFDVVLCMNVLEHIYNYQHLMREMVRILKPNGKFIMYVPFLVVYHPEPGRSLDCYRYARDSLERIAKESCLRDVDIEESGMAMFTASANLITKSLPRLIRPLIFLPAYFLDFVLIKIKPKYKKTFPLGYIVQAKK